MAGLRLSNLHDIEVMTKLIVSLINISLLGIHGFVMVTYLMTKGCDFEDDALVI